MWEGDEDAIFGDVLRLVWVLFENRPALYFCNHSIFISAHKLYNFGFRIKDTVSFFIANNNNYDSNNENIAP